MDDVSALMSLLRSQWVLTLATRTSDAAQATPLFYAVSEPTSAQAPCLVFVSSPHSRHAEHIGEGPTRVGAAILGETQHLPALSGAQLEAWVLRIDALSDAAAGELRASYAARHGHALAGIPPQEVVHFGLFLTAAKLTDNARLGFGRHVTLAFSPCLPQKSRVR